MLLVLRFYQILVNFNKEDKSDSDNEFHDTENNNFDVDEKMIVLQEETVNDLNDFSMIEGEKGEPQLFINDKLHTVVIELLAEGMGMN